MKTPEQFILSHAGRLYDPVKAHEYYVRNRQLKGRKKGLSKPVPALRVASKNIGAPKTPKAQVKGVAKVSPKGTLTEQRQAQVKERVQALKGKLTVLKTILNKLVSEAEAASEPAKKTTKKSTTKSSSSKDSGSELTGTQKREKAKKARDKYQKEHPQLEKEKKDAEREQKIEEVKQKIFHVQTQLKEALARARKMSTQKPAAPGRRKA